MLKTIKAQKLWVHPKTHEISTTRQEKWLYFDSQFEYKVWCVIRSTTNVVTQETGYDFQTFIHYPMQVHPCTAHWANPINWRCDFRLINKSYPKLFLLIEAKGNYLDSSRGRRVNSEAIARFKQILQLLDRENPTAYKNLIVVAPSAYKIGALQTTGLDDFSDALYQAMHNHLAPK